MAISVVQKESGITRVLPAPPRAPAIDRDTSGQLDTDTQTYSAWFWSGLMNASGAVTFTGGPRDKRDGWEVGWIQVEYAETNWAMYRGQHSTDGSLFVQRARPPARSQRVCRDTLGGPETYFTKVGDTNPNEHKNLPPGEPFPLVVRVLMQDSPADWYHLEERNELTGKTNYLDEVQIELKFCTVLTAMDNTVPASRKFYHLAHFYWDVRSHYTFHPARYPPGHDPANWSITPVPNGNGGTASRIFNFAPRDPRVNSVLTTPQGLSCRTVATNEYGAGLTPGNASRHAYRDRNHMPGVR